MAWDEKRVFYYLICIILLQNVRLTYGDDEANLLSLLPTRWMENKKTFFARIRLPALCR